MQEKESKEYSRTFRLAIWLMFGYFSWQYWQFWSQFNELWLPIVILGDLAVGFCGGWLARKLAQSSTTNRSEILSITIMGVVGCGGTFAVSWSATSLGWYHWLAGGSFVFALFILAYQWVGFPGS